jgi:hypothetical protein
MFAEGGATMEQQHWRPTTRDDYEQLIGRDVYTHDGEFMGRVERVLHPDPDVEDTALGHFFVVRPDDFEGPLRDEVAYVPETAIVAANPDAVELNVDVRGLAEQDWARLPVGFDPQAAP